MTASYCVATMLHGILNTDRIQESDCLKNTEISRKRNRSA
jgi:hypothetical protein